MPQVIPIIGGALGIINAIQGIQANQAQQRAISTAERATEEQRAELARLMAILSNPNSPERQALRAQAERAIAQQVAQGSNAAIARLASMGFRAPQSIAGTLGAISQAGVRSQADLEQKLINDFIQKRMALVNPGLPIQGSLTVADLTGRTAAGSGEALGNLLAILTRPDIKWPTIRWPWTPAATPVPVGAGAGGGGTPQFF